MLVSTTGAGAALVPAGAEAVVVPFGVGAAVVPATNAVAARAIAARILLSSPRVFET